MLLTIYISKPAVSEHTCRDFHACVDQFLRARGTGFPIFVAWTQTCGMPTHAFGTTTHTIAIIHKCTCGSALEVFGTISISCLVGVMQG